MPFRLLGLGCFALALWLAGDFVWTGHWQGLPDRLKLVTAFVTLGAGLFWLRSRLASGGPGLRNWPTARRCC
jgi:hypothetical protein